MDSKIDSKLAGLQLAMAMKSQPQVDLQPLETALLALASKVDSKNHAPVIHADTATFDVEVLAQRFDNIAAFVKVLAEKENKIDFSEIAAAIDNVYQAMPEYDFSEIAAAVQDAPDIRPELLAIVSAIGENTSAVRENTQAIEKQNQILMKKRKVTMDAEGKITGIEVV